MIKKVLFFSFVFFIFNIRADVPHQYFIDFKDALSISNVDKSKIKQLGIIQLSKYNETNDKTYLLAYKYSLLYFYDVKKNMLKFITTANEVLRLNNGKYPIVTTEVNNSIAHYLENFSPEIAQQYIDEAIKSELSYNRNGIILPHLYHIKGRLFYHEHQYDKAMEFFKLALEHYKSTDYLYVASMYNNFGLIFQLKNHYKESIINYEKSLKIINRIKYPTSEESNFKQLIIRNLGDAFFDIKDYNQAEIMWENCFDYDKSMKNFEVGNAKLLDKLYTIYTLGNDSNKINQLIDYMENIEVDIEDCDLYYKQIYTSILLKHFIRIHNKKKELLYLEKYNEINKQILDKKSKEFKELSNQLNVSIIEKEKQKYDFEIVSQKRKFYWISFSFFLVVMMLFIVYIALHNKRKKDQELFQKMNLINEQNKKLLEQDMEIQKEKIKNLHLNLNLKQETQIAFLDKLKKVRKSNTVNSEEALKELYFEMNNLIHIDKKKLNTFSDASKDQKIYVKRLSEKFPELNQQELQLCIYFRLDLNAKEIALLEKITDGSVRVYKSKIKSKLGLQKEEKLVDFLNTIK